MTILETVNCKIDENKAEMIASLSNLLSIPSVEGEAEPGMPFGRNVQLAYEYMMQLGKKEGFALYNADNYGGHIDFEGKDTGIVGIVGHLDVVPEGDGWNHDPYGGEVEDGIIYGRGTIDNKGPVIASFYAMKALKECGFEPEKTIRLILGLDEETNWHGMEYYLNDVGEIPDFGFTPDADFPAIHGEKGIMVFDIVRKFNNRAEKGLKLRSLKGGTAANSVADYARAVISNDSGYENVKELIAAFREEKGCKIRSKGIGKSFEITIQGVSAHGAMPEKGENAITIMMEFLGRLNFASEDTNEFIAFYNNCIGYDLHGERIGCALTDEISGDLTFNVGMIDLDQKTAKLTINVRYPVTLNDEIVYEGVMSVIGKYDLGIIKGKHQEPIYIPADDPLIVTLMDIYRKHTGDMESEPLVIGGGTYARAIKNTVAFGALFPGEPDLMHQKNECISVENLVLLTKIYAETIYKLSEMK